MKTQSPPYKVVSAKGTRLNLDTGDQLIDAISSWWCMIHGYSHPDIVSAISDQATQICHVMLGGLTHDPAERLAFQLGAITPGDLSHVFFGDSGSVGVEIALKMAIQYASNQGYVDRSKIAYLTGAYHGDTLGAMSVCDPEDGMHRLFGRVVIPQLQLPRPPKLGAGGDDAYLNQVESILSHNRDAVCAVIIEPLMQGAGGFYLYSPTIVQGVRRICDTLGILLICDEVATGFGRLGSMFASEQCGVVPDIMVLGKALTGGHIGMSATIARPHVFDQFWSDSPDHALMHGPTFMGNPLACRAALASIQLLKEGDVLNRIAQIEQRLGWLYHLRNHSNVVDVRVKGAMGVVEVADSSRLRCASDQAAKLGVWLRPFGNVLYTMPPFTVSNDELDRIMNAMAAIIEN